MCRSCVAHREISETCHDNIDCLLLTVVPHWPTFIYITYLSWAWQKVMKWKFSR